MKKYRFNEDKLLRNIAIISTAFSLGMLVQKVMLLGFSCLTTIYK